MRYSITIIDRQNNTMPVSEIDHTHTYVSSEVEGPDDLVSLDTHDYVIKTVDGMAFHPRTTVERVVVKELEDLRD